MAVSAVLKGKVFVQIGDGELFEVGTVDIPINITAGSDDHDHKLVQHRDGKPPWCQTCGRDALGHPAYSFINGFRHAMGLQPAPTPTNE